MENKNFIRTFLPILLVFIISNGLFLTAGSLATKWNIDTDIVIAGNLVLFIATAVSFFLYFKALRNNNVQAFLRMIYGGMFLKMMICLFAAFIYISVAGKSVNKGGIITCLFLYLVYSFVEIILLLKQSKQRRNA
ncbi:MAG: hypothetical protein H7122_04135 [Chitinophagaceae bacterium]|nr:hypothetical protein [Chitinophagaceae bacterium]